MTRLERDLLLAIAEYVISIDRDLYLADRISHLSSKLREEEEQHRRDLEFKHRNEGN